MLSFQGSLFKFDLSCLEVYCIRSKDVLPRIQSRPKGPQAMPPIWSILPVQALLWTLWCSSSTDEWKPQHVLQEHVLISAILTNNHGPWWVCAKSTLHQPMGWCCRLAGWELFLRFHASCLFRHVPRAYSICAQTPTMQRVLLWTRWIGWLVLEENQHWNEGNLQKAWVTCPACCGQVVFSFVGC